MNSFRSLLLEIGQQLTTAQLDNLKFACIDFIPAGRAEFILQPHSLFLEMERQNKLSETNRDLLASLLQRIGRADLKNKLLEIQEEIPFHPLAEPRPLSETMAREKVTQAMIAQLKLAEKISTQWKFVGRYLSIDDYVLRNIEDTYRRTEERSIDMLTRWLQSSEDTSMGRLVSALRTAGRTDLAEQVQAYCANSFPSLDSLGQALPNNARQQPRENDLPDGDNDDVVPDRAGNTQANAISQPVQVVQEPEDALKKEGSFFDENRFAIIEQIGSGGFAKVYCVLEKQTKETFAVKIVELGMNDRITQQKVQALEKEIKLLQDLKNSYIVKYYKTETLRDTFALFIEYMHGGSIADKLINEGPIKEEAVRKYTWQLLNGIQYLHDNKVIHRDIKGANILLDKDHKHLRLTDFGISLALEGIATSTGHCASGNTGIMASVFWTSPELLCAERYSFNTDIWSLGCTVVEMLKGNPPLRGEGLAFVQAIYKISNYEVKAPEDCTSYAKDFLDHCFWKRADRPSASSLLNQDHFEFPLFCDY